MRGWIRWMAAAVLGMALVACGPAGAPGRGSSRLLTAGEIQASHGNTLFDVVQRLRPAWLLARDHGGARGYPAVFVGSQRLGDITHLRTLSTDNVREVHFHDPIAAASRFGRNVPHGVIQVILDIGG